MSTGDKTPGFTPLLTNDENGSPFRVPPTPFLKKIGYGTGVGVYRMDRSPRTGNTRSPWALKKVNPKIRANVRHRLKKEADLLQTLNHPNIIGFRAFTTAEGREVLAMEEGGHSLGDLIEKRREEDIPPFSPHEIMKVIIGVSKALHYIHNEKKIIHGDIKSFNVLIKENFDVVKLCDFGVSHPLDEAGEAEDYIGTECWCAPEIPHSGFEETDPQINESQIVDPSDNYGTRPPLPDYLGPDYTVVKEIFMWCTEENPNRRPTAQDILKRVGVKC
ncbi:lymphokine-activated killer T-cell-originated protein kinase homolog isoform X2 [Cimex lectularius]|uniref:Protein kinase domain-containing protein n=1 Tax=Cimex lectularius TaxID=79782 RepID=A0A8I6RAP7_CIMLE|nr:lymphokine-activated killer T-cell-originated protein kinase homolog isoform X2 [Cimex lectularius]